jgi:hypothetical protein
MEKAADSTELVSPATTLPWPYSQHSEVSDDAEKQPTMKTPPYRKKYFLPGSDDSSVDLVAVARGIEESQQRAIAYEQEEQMIKDAELITQEAKASAEAAREGYGQKEEIGRQRRRR